MKKLTSIFLVCLILVLSLSSLYLISAKAMQNEKISSHSIGRDSHSVDIVMKGKIPDKNSAEFKAQSISEIAESALEYQPVRVFHSSLQDSVPLINANDSWILMQSSLNLTGAGQTVCIIDTGINYSHSDFGGCAPVSRTHNTSGNISDYPLENDDHPYNDSTSETYSITMPGFTQIAVHFSRMETEYFYDTVEILNSSNSTVATYSGAKYDFWSASVPGDTIRIKLTSDEAYNYSGFYIDKVINGTANTAENVTWAGCSKIIGGWDAVNEDADPLDDDGHGTHVAGIAAAKGSIKGVAPDANLIILKAGDSNGDFMDFNIAQALDWCINNASKYNITVISLSLGGGLYNESCDFFYDGINSSTPGDEIDNYNFTRRFLNASSKNISVVAAAGNNADYEEISFPACMRNIIPVSATTKLDAIDISYSNRNSLVKLLAPGTDINSTCYTGGYCTLDGTSMATPHVAGAIAIINQYLNLTSRKKTPSQIETALNLTGKRINDSGYSNLLYSRIDVYAALMSFDNQNPNVTLASPVNNRLDADENQTFTCNATDWQLKNITFYLWNASNELINSSSFNVSGTSNETSVAIYNLAEGSYKWNCRACDNASAYAGGSTNCGYASSNFTLTIGDISVTLNSPSNNTYTSSTSKTFNCTSQTADDLSLSNVTFYLWHSNGTLKNTTTTSIAGTSNITLFSYTFSSTADGRYYWNCLAYNNESSSAWAVKNYTITFDNNNPAVTLESPEDGDDSYEEDEEVTFEYDASDSVSGIANCSLLIDGDIEDIDSAPIAEEFVYEDGFSEREYDWAVVCYDYAGNSNETDEFTIDIQAADEGDDGGGGSGGGDDEPPQESEEEEEDEDTTSQETEAPQQALNPTKEETAAGYTAALKTGGKINFVLEVEREINSTNGTETRAFNESHSISILEIGNSSVNLSIASKPINLTLRIGEAKKINLTSADYYDLYVRLNNITSENETSKANITIKTIKEPIKGGLSKFWIAVKSWAIKNKLWLLIGLGVIVFIIINIITDYCIICRLMKKKSPITTKEFSRYESYHLPKKKKAESQII